MSRAFELRAPLLELAIVCWLFGSLHPASSRDSTPDVSDNISKLLGGAEWIHGMEIIAKGRL